MGKEKVQPVKMKRERTKVVKTVETITVDKSLSVGEMFIMACAYKDCVHKKECESEKFNNRSIAPLLMGTADLGLVKEENGIFSIGCSKYMSNKEKRAGKIQCRDCGWKGLVKDLETRTHKHYADDDWDPSYTFSKICPRCRTSIPQGDLK